MVEDNASLITLPDSICTIIDVLFLSTTETNKTDNVVGTGLDGIVSNSDSWIGGCLTKDGNMVFEFDVTSKRNDSSHVKHNGTIGPASYRSSERSCTRVVQIGDMNNCGGTVSLASARNISSVTFGTGECWCVISHRGNTEQKGRK